jgi:hypothetical protein
MLLIHPMFLRHRHKAFRRASWLAVFAILLQAILPAIHHPAMAAPVGADLARSLCLAPGSTTPADPAKSPAHHLPGCAICMAAHAIGGFVPPTAPVIAIGRDHGFAVPASALIFLPRQWLHIRQQPRAPPILV